MTYDHLAASELTFPITQKKDRKEYLALGAFLLRPALDGLGRAGRPALERVIDAAGAWMRSLANHLINGVLPLGKWFAAVAQGLIGRHYAGTLALTGGETPPAPALDTLDREIDHQAGLLARWRNQLAGAIANPQTPAQGPNPVGVITSAVGGLVTMGGSIVSRAGRYAGPIWSTAMKTLRKSRDGKARFERRFLETGLHHCGDCPHLASLGWQPVGTLPDIGQTECNFGCRCWFDWR